MQAIANDFHDVLRAVIPGKRFAGMTLFLFIPGSSGMHSKQQEITARGGRA
jgi:hypothetical protein